MKRSYELVMVFTPVLTQEELQQTIDKYRKMLVDFGGEIVHEDFWGLKQLAYPIKRKTTGIYMITEFQASTDVVSRLEIQYRRDERILRFLTVRLDKYAIEYNEKRRKGLVGPNRKKAQEEAA